MECQRAQEVLATAGKGGEPDPHLPEACRHLERCTECQRFLRHERRLVARLRSLALEEAPGHLRDRVQAALQAEWSAGARASGPSDPAPPSGRPEGGEVTGRKTKPQFAGPWPNRPTAVAASFVLGLSGGWLLAGVVGGPGDARGPSGVATEDVGEAISPSIEGFVQQAVQDTRRLTSNSARVTAFIWDELGVDFSPPGYAGFDLVGVEFCVWGDKKGAVVMYQRMGQVLYHFVLANDEETGPREPRLSAATPERWEGEEHPSVAVWGTEQLQEALVGNLDPTTILSFASTAREDELTGLPS